MNLHLNRNQLFICILLWESVFLLLSAYQFNSFQLLNILGFVTLAFLPGALTIALLKIDNLHLWSYIGLSVGFSLTELMVAGLLENVIQPYFGFSRPLDAHALLAEFAFTVTLLASLVRARKAELHFSLRESPIFGNIRDRILALIPTIFVAMSIFGAIRLNNGGGGTLTLAMLIGIAVYAAVLIYFADNVGPNVIPTALFFISLAFLLMTSLRGWYISGHDIQREFGVFQLAKNAGLWDIALYRDAYNACLSITIVPTIFSNLLKISDPYIYKVLFQVLFATVPALLFLSLRRYASATVALLSTLYFISFPTFFGDMPFLNRQEIAFFFLALMLYLAFDTALSQRLRQVLFVIFGVGMVLSHYTTTYIVVALLIFLIVMRPIVLGIGKHLATYSVFRNSAFAFLRRENQPKVFVTVWMVIVLAGASFIWSSVLTNTASGSLSRVIAETVAVIRSNIQGGFQSSDINYNLFSSHRVDPAVLYTSYQKNVVIKARAEDPRAYYSESTYANYSTPLVSGDKMPLTAVGNTLQSKGFDVTLFNTISRQASARFLQVLIVVGLLVALFSSQFVESAFALEFVLLAVASLLFIAAQVILPVLSVEYGVLRAFQQALFFLSIFIVGGSMSLLYKASHSKKIFFASTLAILFLLSSTGVITQLLGGYGAQLHLSNSGSYYDDYYLHKSEVVAAQWLKNREVDPGAVQTSVVLAYQLGLDSNPNNGLYPGLIRKDSYVFLGVPNVTKEEAIVSYQGTELIYAYPVTFLEQNKDLIYNNGGSKIFR